MKKKGKVLTGCSFLDNPRMPKDYLNSFKVDDDSRQVWDTTRDIGMRTGYKLTSTAAWKGEV